MFTVLLSLVLSVSGVFEEPVSPPPYGVEAPVITQTTLAWPLPRPYVASRDPFVDINAALALAERDGKFVLIDLGANWCPDCLILSGMMKLPVFEEFMEAHFVRVYVDVGKFDQNMDVVAELGLSEQFTGIPMVVILTPSLKVINATTSSEWVTIGDRDPQDALNYFARYAPVTPTTAIAD